jgi:hypothetical protein
LTRHELKEQLQHDQFTDAVSHVITYTTENKQRVTAVAIVVAVVLAIAGGLWWYFSYQRSVRQRDLQAVFTILDAQVGPPSELAKTFLTEQAKTQASIKALSDMVAKDGGTREGLIAQYYLGTLKAQQGDTKGAEADLSRVADSSNDSSSLAKIALAQLYMGQGRASEAQKLLQSLIEKPTDLVSKGQAQILLARLQETSNPKAAKALLQSLKSPSQPGAVARAANELETQLSQ